LALSLHHSGRLRKSALVAAGLLTVLATAPPARAQVFEVAADGELRQIDRAPAPAPPRRARHPVRTDLRRAIEAAARATDLSPEFLEAVARTESGLDPAAVSPAGAIGVMQLMPGTAAALGVDPHDPSQNIMGGARYLRTQLDRFEGQIDLALAAYNAGSGRVVRFGGMPPFPETRAYVGRNLDRLAQAAEAHPQGVGQ
jgi:soluble lytic murein transglycosylase-like protein